jgi:predicted membrane-bound mannosyltransferase
MALMELRSDLREGWAATPRAELIALVVITLIALAVRVAYINQPIRYDEADTFVHYVDQPLKHSLRYNYVPNNHVFHTLLSRPLRLMLGGDPWVLRLVAMISGVLCVPAGYLAARAHYGRGAGLLAAALIAGSSSLVEFSTNARGYTLLALITLLQIALAAHVVRRPNRPGWLLFALLAALGF